MPMTERALLAVTFAYVFLNVFLLADTFLSPRKTK